MLSARSEVERTRSAVYGVKGWRYKLWWSGNSDGTQGLEVLVKELCEKVVEVRRKSDRVMTVVMAFEEEVVRINMCVLYVPQSGRTGAEKERFYNDLRSDWDLHSVGVLVWGMGDFNGHVGKRIEGYEGVHRGSGIGERNVEGKTSLEFFHEMELCVANTWFRRGEEESDVQRRGKWDGD